MTSIAKTSVAKFAAIAVGIALAFSFALPAQALTQAEATAIITALGLSGSQAAVIQALVTPSAPAPSSAACTFTRALTLGASGADVTCLQNYLIGAGYSIPAGATGYFGAQTQAAVKAWQAANGVSPAAGYFGPLSQAKYQVVAGSSTPSTPTGPVAAGAISVAPAAQPANSLAPQGASRVPFTKFQVTAGASEVTINSVVVQRVGLGSNAAFSGVVLIDQDGNQLGTAKSFNSNDQATIGEAVKIPAGQTRTFTVAANMASSLLSYAGEAPAISVVNLNTSAAVSGSLPIVGAYHTMNSTLTVGSVTMASSNAHATNANATKEIGTTAYKQNGLRLTAGSAEDLRFKMIRYNQTGSASAVNDLANIKVVVNGTAYPAVVSADGKYVSANFGAGILVPKGDSVEVYVQYDIIGSGSSGRTVIFDVDKTTDILFEGVKYGYGVSPAAGGSSVPTSRGTFTITSGTPFVYDTQTTISGASVTTIAKANSVAAQNVAVNLANQPLGGFNTDIKGEAITVQSMVFTVSTSSGSGHGLLTNVTIVDQNGAVVAGPVDASGAGTSLTFSDSVTFPTGQRTYTLRGKIASTIGDGTIYTLSTNPSSQWTNVKGDVTGNTVSLSSNGSFSMNQMTVKTGSLAIGRAATFASKTIVAGGTLVEMARFQLDAQQSGEDIRLSSFLATSTATGTNLNVLSSCQFFDGATGLNTGSNVLNPSGAAGDDHAFTVTFDNPLTIAKGTVKTLNLKCNLSSSASGTYNFDHGTIGSFSPTGAVSGNSITASELSDSAAIITVGAGSLSVTTDASSPGYKLVEAGSVGNTIGAFKFTAGNEAVNLTQVGLKLTNTASSSASDLAGVRLYDSANNPVSPVITFSGNYATTTLSSVLNIPANDSKTLTLKADLSEVGNNEAVAFSGHFVAVDVDANGSNTKGVGADSGTTINATGSTSVAGVRVMDAFPTVAIDSLSSTGVTDGKLMRFKVTNNTAESLGITNFAVNLATTSMAVTNVTIKGFTDSSYSTPITGVSADGNLQATNDCTSGCSSSSPNLAIGITDSSGTATVIQIGAGETRYFEVSGSVAGVVSGSSVTTKLLGNSSFPATSAGVSANPLLAAGASAFTATTDMVWSPNSTTSAAVRADQDWTNGFGVAGLPSGGLVQTRSQ